MGHLHLITLVLFLAQTGREIRSRFVGMVCRVVQADNALKRGEELETVVDGKCGGFPSTRVLPNFSHCLSGNSLLVYFYF